MAANYFNAMLALLILSLSGPAMAANPTKKIEKSEASVPDSSMPATWQKLSAEERAELLKSYQALRQLDDKDRQDLQQRMEWFSQLPKDQQQRMREVWQNMSDTEREHWKAQLKTANSPEKREALREKIMQKYD
ncbi:hypothetical protein BKE30_04245 [Alkanindiges hydrocarboniclasticus]|jgi:thioesterase domain-containing protein|uniref:DUF3106 domain-containing protein n=2 Tax=Alkanindiges hydrocarboniclasticus TaxID=1907941 RepID=A0A1S8CXV9_9GAMM|nr:hypothetical protein BKE30_04245 [Alkanindiges hydrocarboniclasticus]